MENKKSFQQRILGHLLPQDPLHLYVSAPPGSGKALLMDVLECSLPAHVRVKRTTLWDFTEEVRLRVLELQAEIYEQHEGGSSGSGDGSGGSAGVNEAANDPEYIQFLADAEADALAIVISDVVEEADVYVISNFTVEDTLQALLCRRLFSAIFESKAVFVATSTQQISSLYRHGACYEQFLPTVHLLEANVRQMELGKDSAFGFNDLEHLGGPFFVESDPETASSIDETFAILSGLESDVSLASSPVHVSHGAAVVTLENSKVRLLRRLSLLSVVRCVLCVFVGGGGFEARGGRYVRGRRTATEGDIFTSVSRFHHTSPLPPTHPTFPSLLLQSLGSALRAPFSDLCGADSGLSTADYRALAQRFSAVILEGVPDLGSEDSAGNDNGIAASTCGSSGSSGRSGERDADAAVTERGNFIALVDELFDHKRRLVLSAAKPPLQVCLSYIILCGVGLDLKSSLSLSLSLSPQLLGVSLDSIETGATASSSSSLTSVSSLSFSDFSQAAVDRGCSSRDDVLRCFYRLQKMQSRRQW